MALVIYTLNFFSQFFSEICTAECSAINCTEEIEDSFTQSMSDLQFCEFERTVPKYHEHMVIISRHKIMNFIHDNVNFIHECVCLTDLLYRLKMYIEINI